MGSAVQKKLASLFICARNARQILPKIMVYPAFLVRRCPDDVTGRNAERSPGPPPAGVGDRFPLNIFSALACQLDNAAPPGASAAGGDRLAPQQTRHLV